MFSPNLGRWVTMDPIGYYAGDPNLYGVVGNNPITGLDPTGLAVVATPAFGVVGWLLGVRLESGEGDPPDRTTINVPSITVGQFVYKLTNKAPDMIQWTKQAVPRVVYKRTSAITGGTITEDVTITGFGWRRFVGKVEGIAGNHVAYIVVRATFTNRSEAINCVKRPLPDRWEQYGFSLNYRVYLRTIEPALNNQASLKMDPKNHATYEEFIWHFINLARAIPAGPNRQPK
jgi:hypothetical protein